MKAYLRFWFYRRRGKHANSLKYSLYISIVLSDLPFKLSQFMRQLLIFRQILSINKELAHKLGELERKIGKHDADIQTIFEAIRMLSAPPVKPKPQIGFHSNR